MARRSIAQETEIVAASLAGRSIVLVGLMGAGKSTVGRRLAQRLNVNFVDADTAIEEAAGMSIPEIFTSHGEPYFREGERRVTQRTFNGRSTSVNYQSRSEQNRGACHTSGRTANGHQPASGAFGRRVEAAIGHADTRGGVVSDPRELERRAYAFGHYSQIMAFWVVLAVLAFQVIHTELHPVPLVEACPVKAVKP